MVADFIDNAFSRLNGDYGSKIDVNKLELEVEYTQRTECNTCSYLTMKERALETQTYDIRKYQWKLDSHLSAHK